MGESSTHISLVNILRDYVISEVPPEEKNLVLVEAPGAIDLPPKNRDKFRPDVEYWHNERLIIGDAKSSSDLESRHSRSQIESYIQDCQDFSGDAMLVIAVPFEDSARACSVISTIQRRLNTSVPYVILNEGGVYTEQ